MKTIAMLAWGIIVAASASLFGVSARAASFVYVANADDGDIGVYRLLDSGELQPGARVKAASIVMPMAVSPDRRFLYAATRHITPNGKFRYVSERTNSTLNALAVDGASGKLTYLSSAPTERQPRGFAIDPKGRFLVASGEKSDTVSVYSIDQATGALKLLDKYPAGKGANWVEIVSFD
jgi:6-phosphogluconolactonase